MSTTDAEYRKLKINEELRVDAAKKIVFRDDAIYIHSNVDGQITISADTRITLDGLTVMGTGHVLAAQADGIITLYKAGTISDADLVDPSVGHICLDTTNDRIYFRTGSAEWHYCAADAGKQFKERVCKLCGNLFKLGDEVKWVIDKFMSDGAPHSIPVHGGCVT